MKKNNPVHVDAVYLSWLSQQKDMITLSPKADGIYSEIRIGRYNFIGELININGHDIYLIFDTLSYPIKHKDNIVNRMKWIRNMHPIATKLNIDKSINNSGQFIDLCKQDIFLFKEYINDNNDAIKWYPKIMITSNMECDVFLKLLDTNIDEYLLYKTDGWIITSLKKNYKTVAKYKPKNELTIDLLLDNDELWKTSEGNIIENVYPSDNCHYGEIWRCVMTDTSWWMPKDLRKDKKLPNKKWIVDTLVKLHKNYWSATDLIPYIKSYYYDHQHKKLDNDDINYLNLQKNIFDSNIRKIFELNHNINNVLDIGCGKGKLIDIIKKYSMEGYINFNKINIVGFDIDANNIINARQKFKYENCKWLWASMNMDINNNNIYDNIYDNNMKYDLIILNNTIQNCDNLKNFIGKIKNIINDNGYIYIHFIDYDLIKNMDINNVKCIDLNNRLYQFKYSWTNLEIKENLVSCDELENILYEYGYNKIDINNNSNIEGKFKDFHKCNKFVVYQYKC
jgi:SAM-dependent methyltransferase